MKRLVLALCALTIALSSHAQFKPLKDFWKDRNLWTASSLEKTSLEWVPFKNAAWFIAKSDMSGNCVYRTDGTPEGTELTIDVAPGSSGPKVLTGLTVADDKLFFLVNDSTRSGDPLNLYVSDGTTESVKRVGNAEVIYTDETSVVALGGNVFFTARDSQHGYELWTSDGTEQGTRMVKDILPGVLSSTDNNTPFIFSAAGGNVYFRAKDATHGFELWKTDGTAENTFMVIDLNSTPNANGLPKTNPLFASMHGTLYFVVSGNGIWKSGGTAGTTAKLNTETSEIKGMVAWRNLVLFNTSTAVFRTDGSATGTFKIADAYTTDYNDTPIDVGAEFQNSYYFMTYGKIWKTDGTVAGTQSKTIDGQFLGMGANSKAIILIERDGTNQTFEPWLWAYDGDVSLTHLFSGVGWSGGILQYPPYMKKIRTFDDKFLLAYTASNQGLEPWITDGTPGSMTILKDVFRGTWSGYEANSMVAVGSKLFFEAVYGDGEFWVSDGTEQGTHILKDFVQLPEIDNVHSVTDFNGIALFFAHDGFWRSDGTEAGTVRIGNSGGSGPVIGNYMYYASGDGLLKTNGLQFGATVVKGNLNGGNGYVRAVGRLGESSLFLGLSNGDFWVSDLTTNGTVKLNAPGVSPTGYQIFPAGRKTFFQVAGNNYDYQLGVTDGTSEGTLVPKLFADRNDYLDFGIHCTLDTVAIFTARTNANGRELWRSDGTAEGTYMLKDIFQGQGNSEITPIYHDSVFYFTARTATEPNAMWKTDGTIEGTERLFTLPNGFKAARKNYYEPNLGTGHLFKGQVLFKATSHDTGSEIWRTDFTEEGTFPLGEIVPGPNSAEISEIALTSTDYFFVARDEMHGRNLYKVDHDYTFKKTQSIDFETVETKVFGTPPFGLTAKASSNLDVTFEVVSGPATISGTTLTITATGVVVVKAIQRGNSEYYPTSKTRTFNVESVEKQEQTIVFEPVGFKRVNDPPFKLKATVTSGLPIVFEVVSGPATIEGDTLTIKGTGLVEVSAVQAGNHDYLPAIAEQSFPVLSLSVKFDQVITFTPIGAKQSDDPPFELNAVASSGLPVTFQIVSGPASISGNILTLKGGGTVTVKATQAGDENFKPATKEQTFTVAVVTGLETETFGISIHPNPATSTIVVNLPTSPAFKAIELKDILGRDVFNMEVAQQQISLDVEKFPRGIYIVRLIGDDRFVYSKRIILK